MDHQVTDNISLSGVPSILMGPYNTARYNRAAGDL